MNKFALLTLLLALTTGIHSAVGPLMPKTLEEAAAAREALRARIAARTGGMIARPHTAGSKFVFINAQKLVRQSELTDPVATMARILRHDICLETPVSPAAFSLANAQELIKAQQAKGAIFIVEDDVLPTILVAPEAAWGVVNVRKLNTDRPDGLVLAQRTRRELWRVFAMVNGGGNTRMGKCVMQTVLSLHDIDALGAEAFCPEPVNAVTEHLRRLGIKAYATTTYKQACKEGWAPAPTNDIQRAIWEKVRADKERGPSKPITIPPPGK